MNANMKRRIEAMEASQPSAEPLRITVEFVCPQRGAVAARLPDGQHLERREGETEADFLARVEAAR